MISCSYISEHGPTTPIEILIKIPTKHASRINIVFAGEMPRLAKAYRNNLSCIMRTTRPSIAPKSAINGVVTGKYYSWLKIICDYPSHDYRHIPIEDPLSFSGFPGKHEEYFWD